MLPLRLAPLAALAFLLPLLAPTAAHAATIHVPGEQPTIQAGIDAAAPGDTVLVAPGTYVESLIMRGGVTLRSEAGVPTAIVQQNLIASCLRCEEVSNVLIEGMVFRRGGGTSRGDILAGGDVLCVGSQVVMNDCEIRDGGLFDELGEHGYTYGAGIACLEGAEVSLRGGVIDHNYNNPTDLGPQGFGGGIYCDASSSFEAREVDVTGCTALLGGGAASEGVSFLMEDCVIEGNRAWTGGGFEGTGTLRRCLVRENECIELPLTDAGGVLLRGGLVEECLIMGNRAVYGAGILVHPDPESGATARRNTIYGNRGAYAVQIVSEGNGQPITFEGSIVAENSDEGVRFSLICPPAAFRCNDVWGNPEGDYIGCPDPTGTEGNISQDPLFCDPATGNFHIAEQSPCAPAQQPECGLIGALGVGCGISATETATWGAVKRTFR